MDIFTPYFAIWFYLNMQKIPLVVLIPNHQSCTLSTLLNILLQNPYLIILLSLREGGSVRES